MFKCFKEPINRKLGILILIFILSFVSIILTDFIICKILFGQNAVFKAIESQAASLIHQQQQIALIIKSGFGLLGLVCFLFISRQIFAIISGLEKIQKTLKDQNLKIIRKSIELSYVMRQFEDQNYDLELSRKELNKVLLDLKAKEMDQRIIFDNSPLGIIRFDDKGEIKECNDKFVELMGSTREQLIGFNTAKQSTPEMRKAIKKTLKGKAATIETRYTSITGGRTLDIRVVFNPVNPNTSPTPVIASIEDITKRKNAEKQLKKSYSELEEIVKEKTSELIKEIDERKSAHAALQKSEEKYRSILESMQDSYFELDEDGSLIFFNNSLLELLGYTEQELEGLNYKDFIEKEEHEKL
ncbi:MAG: PAS domain S-box protein, partial [Desulfobacteraceae bacterium]|nr:PAS domain S-box protein [Desulfobacteraceae bacterium]